MITSSKTFILNDRMLKIDLSSLERTCNAVNFKLSQQIQRLLTRLLMIHYTGKLHVIDSNHVELSIPDPELLQEDGPKELSSKHLYINLSKFAAEGHNHAARCVKTNKFYNIKDLLEMRPIEMRHRDRSYKWYLSWDPEPFLKNYKNKDILSAAMVFGDTSPSESTWVSPGELIPVDALPVNHPAVAYLNDRGFTDMTSLVKQFNTSFCVKENPQLKHLKLGKDTKDYVVDPFKFFTPQGCLIFTALQLGKPKLWQARVLDRQVGNDKLLYAHFVDDPYGRISGYYKVAEKDSQGKFIPIEGVYPSIAKKKYYLSPGSKAGNVLMGFDAAREFNLERTPGSRVIGLCEGVMDAARMGPPFCAYLGGSLSVGQLKLISNGMFDRIILAVDHDTVGNSTASKLRRSISMLGGISVDELDYPLAYKDLGEIMDQNIILDLKRSYELY